MVSFEIHLRARSGPPPLCKRPAHQRVMHGKLLCGNFRVIIHCRYRFLVSTHDVPAGRDYKEFIPGVNWVDMSDKKHSLVFKNTFYILSAKHS